MVAKGNPIKKHVVHVNKEITHVFGRLSTGRKPSTDAVKVSAQQNELSNPKVNSIKKNMADKELAALPNVGMALAIVINATNIYTLLLW